MYNQNGGNLDPTSVSGDSLASIIKIVQAFVHSNKLSHHEFFCSPD